VLDSAAEGPEFKSQVATLSGNSRMQTVHSHCASVHQAAKLVAAFLRVARVTALEIASPGNRHCASCIGTLSFPVHSNSQYSNYGKHLLA